MPATPHTETRIFIVGFPRSGTTLVQSLLAAHSAMTSFTESHFFWRHFSHLPWVSTPVLTRDPSARVGEFLAENGEAPPEAARWFAPKSRWILRVRPLLPLLTVPVAQRLLQVFDDLARRRRRSGWIEKTPKHLRYVPFLQWMSRGHRTHFVHVIRHGLEAVSSLHDVSRHWERPYDLDTCVRRWNADVGFSLQRVASPLDHFVVYEDLVAGPEVTLTRLLDELELGWEPDILARHADSAPRLVTSQEPWKANVGHGIHPARTSGHVLTAVQREQVVRSLRGDLYDRILERARRQP